MSDEPISTDLPVLSQGINIDIESIAPVRAFGPEAYDVANMTITATVNAPEERVYRLVLAADVEAGTSAFVRVISATDDAFAEPERFRRLTKAEAVRLLEPVLAKAGEPLTAADEKERKVKLEALSKSYKIADLRIPAGQQVLRIHASQKLSPVDGDARRYRFTMYAPQLSLAPVSNVRLGATVVFPLDFKARVEQVLVEPMPGQPPVNLVGGGDSPIALGLQTAYAWAFQSDPKITLAYRYPA